MKPVIIINFKTYPHATGNWALRLAKMCEEVAHERNADIRIAVQAADIYRISSQVTIPVYAQHVDPIKAGRDTGFILSRDVAAAGAIGTLLNHSEHRLEPEVLAAAAQEAEHAGLKVVICAENPAEGTGYIDLSPEFIAVEPPELIGGNVSVSSAHPEIIKHSVKLLHAPVLVGAGIHTAKDVAVAVELGAKGVLIASSITTAKDARAALESLLE